MSRLMHFPVVLLLLVAIGGCGGLSREELVQRRDDLIDRKASLVGENADLASRLSSAEEKNRAIEEEVGVDGQTVAELTDLEERLDRVRFTSERD